MKKPNIMRDAIILIYSRGINMIASLVYGMILVREFTKIEYSVFSQVLIVVSLFVTFFGLSIANSINYFLPKSNNEEEQKAYMSHIIFVVNVLGLSSVLFMIIGKDLISIVMNNQLSDLIILSCLLPYARIISSLFDNFFIVRNKAKMIAIRLTLFSFLQIFNVLLVSYFDLGVKELLVILSVTEVLFAIYVLCALHKELKGIKFLSYNYLSIKEILIFSFPLAVAGMVGTLNIEINKILISNIFGLEKLAEYVVLSKELPLTIVASSITAVFLPQIAKMVSKKQYVGASELWKKSIENTYVLNSWIIGVLIIGANEAIEILYSSKYLSGVIVFQIFIVILFFRLTYFGMILNANGESRKVLFSSIVSLIANLLFFVILYPLLGYLASAISVLLSVLVMNGLQIYYSYKILGVSITKILPYEILAKVLFVNFLIGLIVYYLKSNIIDSYISNPLGNLFIVSIMWFLAYCIVFWKRIINIKNELRN